MADNADTNPGGDDSAPDEPKKPAAEQTDDDIISEAKKRRALCVSKDAENRTQGLDDLRFLIGGDNQWDPKAVQARRNDGRPVITVNTMPTYLHQVTNDQRQNTPAIKVAPTDDKADVETAKIMQGLIRHIEYDSNADVAYDRAVNSAASIGWGYFRLITDYEAEDSFDQCIKFQSIRNHLSVRLDPFSIEPDGSDAKFAFVESVMSREEFKREYPDATANSAALSDDASFTGWITEDSVLVTEYYRIEREYGTLCEYADGVIKFKLEGEKHDPAYKPVRERPSSRSKVMLYKLTATDILERGEIKCQWIPVFPVYGDEVDVEGDVTRSGIIRHAKGPAQSYNVFMTSATEEVAMRTKAPYIGAEGQFEGYEADWAQANTRAFAFLEYKPTSLDGKLNPAPQRQAMADVPAGMLAMAMHAADNIKKTTGLFDASLGARGTATSGKQELAQQREGDMANFHYADGLNRTVRHVGRCLVDMIPSYYDGARTVRILGEDNAAEYVKVNQPNVQGKPMKDGSVPPVVNDLTVGKYDVVIKAGPSYSTMREESREFFTNAMQAAKDPATASVVTYLAIKNQDVPGADTAAKMLEALLPPPAKAVLDEEKKDGEQAPAPMVQTSQGPIPADQAGQVIEQLHQATQQMSEELKKGEAAKAQAEAMRAQESMQKAQHAQQTAIRDQELEPARMETEQMKLQADIAKANAEIKKAEAAWAQAQVDLKRAEIEQAILPERMQIEAAQAQEKVITTELAARQALEPEEEPDIPGMVSAEVERTRPPMPKSMSIKTPSGATYEVALH